VVPVVPVEPVVPVVPVEPVEPVVPVDPVEPVVPVEPVDPVVSMEPRGSNRIKSSNLAIIIYQCQQLLKLLKQTIL
jgi:hypothetical protein